MIQIGKSVLLKEKSEDLVSKNFQQFTILRANKKQMTRKWQVIDENIPQFACLECNQICISQVALISHMKCSTVRPSINYQTCQVKNDLPCTHCSKLCSSQSWLTRHLKIYNQ